MVGSFACPECGSVVAPRGNTPGRRVRCGVCGTLVEVPFLPRASSRSYARRSRLWIWPVAGLAGAVLMVAIAVKVAHSRGLAAREAEVAASLAEADRSEKSGLFDEALGHANRALKVARALGPGAKTPVQRRRDALALRDAEARLVAVEASPDPISTLRALRSRVETDRGMEPLRDRVAEALADALARQAEHQLDEARRALAAGNPAQAMSLCEAIAATADELGRMRAGGLKDAARSVAEATLGRFGVAFAPVTGEFLQGPNSGILHAKTLYPIVAEALRRKGYLPKPERSAFLALWDEASPFRITGEVIESEDGTFFQTPLRTATLRGYFALFQGPRPLWQARPVGKTRVPPPSMSAFEMSHYSLARQRDPAIEKRFYDDAREALAEALGGSFRTLPPP